MVKSYFLIQFLCFCYEGILLKMMVGYASMCLRFVMSVTINVGTVSLKVEVVA